jgi:thiamine-phosphate pyrophosphorylase
MSTSSTTIGSPVGTSLNTGGTQAPHPLAGVYGLTPEWDDTDRLLEGVRAAARGGMRVLQLRRKLVTPEQRRAQALALRDETLKLGVLFIINDDWRLALEVGADGVHLGRDDGDIAAARVAGPHLRIGATCYNELPRAQAALAAGADHLAFGAVFGSPTKPAAVHAPLSLFAQARALPGAAHVPLVAIGGITPDNAAQVTAAGADALAVISALFDSPDIEATARRLHQAFGAKPAGLADAHAAAASPVLPSIL